MKMDFVDIFLGEGYLLSPDLVGCIDDNFENLINLLKSNIHVEKGLIVLNKDIINVVNNKFSFDINWLEFEGSRTNFEKGKGSKMYITFLNLFNKNIEKEGMNFVDEGKIDEVGKDDNKSANVIVLKSYNEEPKKREVQDFVYYFRSRYDSLKKMLSSRIELQNLISINRLKGKKDGDNVSLIGMVLERNITKNGTVILKLEDFTDFVKIVINKNNSRIIEICKDIVEDEVIGVNGVVSNDIIFANSIIMPGVPIKEIKKSDDEVYVAFISDIHVGSKHFLEEEFVKFVKWLNGEYGNNVQKEIALKVKYLFIVGDLVDGCGIFPGQEMDLVIRDVVQQYDHLAELLGKIRVDLKIIICPGNHDAMRTSEPQPVLYKDMAAALWGMKNVVMVSNPALVNINASINFGGFDVLMYHGNSFHYYIDNVDNLRLSDARDNPSLVVKYLLQKRHLAPTHSSSLRIPEIKEDPLVIDKLPDIFVAGEMHRSDSSSYNNILIINSSCWQAKTAYQEKVGNNPDPCKVPILNLKTREIKMLNFSSQNESHNE